MLRNPPFNWPPSAPPSRNTRPRPRAAVLRSPVGITLHLSLAAEGHESKVMTTKPKTTRPSSPREFFQRLYGHLEKQEDERQDDGGKRDVQELITPVPILASPLPFLLPPGNDTHLTAAAAAGLSAFCKIGVRFYGE